MRTIIILFTVFLVQAAIAQTPQKITYTYDDLSRLSTVIYPNGTQIVYTYDALGNRQTQVVSNGACTSPAAPSVAGVSINSGQTATLTATGCGGTVTWYNATMVGTNLGTGASYTTPALTTNTTYYASCTVSCESGRGSGVVTVNGSCTPPAAPSLPQIGSLTYQPFTLTATGCAGTVKWFYNATDTAPIYTGNPYVTPIVFSTKTYYATCTLGSCESVKAGTTLNITPCPTTAVHGTGSLTPNLYQAQTITSQKDISNRTFYRAGRSITLNTGFQAGANELFLAEIGSCLTMPENGLVAYYPFNSNADDESRNGNNGSPINSTLQADRRGGSGNSYSFGTGSDNLGSGIVIPNSASLQFANSFTFSFWAKGNNTSGLGYDIFFSKDGSLNNRPPNYAGDSDGIVSSFLDITFANPPEKSILFKVDNTRVGNNIYNTTTILPLSFSRTQWNNFTITYDGATQKIFLNGNLLSSLNVNFNLAFANTRDLIIGGSRIENNNLSTSYKFRGQLDDIRIYNRALTDNEVQSIYTIER